MNWKHKTAIVLGVILVIAALAFIIKYQRDIIAKQRYAEQSVVEMKKLRDDIVRAQAGYATKKDIEEFAKNSGVDLKPIKDDLKKLDAEIKGVSVVLSTTGGFRGSDIGSTGSTPRPDSPGRPTVTCPDGQSVECPSQDEFGHLSATRRLRLSEPFSGRSVPWGEVGFSAWKKKPWELTVLPRKYKVVNVLSMNDDGRHFVHSKMMIESDGEEYAVPIESKFVEKLPEASFRFSPRLYLGVDGGVKANPPAHAEFVPSLQLSLFSYGMTRTNPDWTFLGLGLGYEVVERGVAVVVSPINYNVAHHLPFVENMHVGPTIAIDPAGNLSLLLGVRVGL
jgi:hypothetical protein